MSAGDFPFFFFCDKVLDANRDIKGNGFILRTAIAVMYTV